MLNYELVSNVIFNNKKSIKYQVSGIKKTATSLAKAEPQPNSSIKYQVSRKQPIRGVFVLILVS
jgi:hypothetical protein